MQAVKDTQLVHGTVTDEANALNDTVVGFLTITVCAIGAVLRFKGLDKSFLRGHHFTRQAIPWDSPPHSHLQVMLVASVQCAPHSREVTEP